MNLKDQDRQVLPIACPASCHPERSEGSLSMTERCFAALSMTLPIVLVNIHYRPRCRRD
jgi:hypothetical protein